MAMFYFYLIAGLALLALELATGAFYLLVTGIAFLLASVMALISHGWLYSTLSAGILSLIGCFIIKKGRFIKHGHQVGSLVGHDVEILEINKQQLRVFYRGTYWDAKLLRRDINAVKQGDKLKIVKVHGNILELD